MRAELIHTKTYQDLLQVNPDEESRMKFVRDVISDYQGSEFYNTARVANEYFKKRNLTIRQYQKILYTVTGKAIPDNWSANFKISSSHFFRFIVQECQFLLGNGATWENKDTANKLGTAEKPFDNQLRNLAEKALWGGAAYGFFDSDHIEVFSALQFVPLLDEFTSNIMAGVRYWRIADNKPLIATLYELDGYTHYLWLENKETTPGENWERVSSTLYYQKKRGYQIKEQKTKADGVIESEVVNYPTFPIVPLWGNQEHQSEIVGLREKIDAVDLISSKFCDDVDEASYVYWTLSNAGGMDEIDLAKFVERLKTIKAAKFDDEVQAESHSIDVPFESREALLTRLNKELYRDAMALNIEDIASGNVVVAQIDAAYEPLNQKTTRFEYCVLNFIYKILKLAGIEDNPTFTRDKLTNKTEEIQAVSQSAAYLTDDYVTKKILTILGDGDQSEDIIAQMRAEDLPKLNNE